MLTFCARLRCLAFGHCLRFCSLFLLVGHALAALPNPTYDVNSVWYSSKGDAILALDALIKASYTIIPPPRLPGEPPPPTPPCSIGMYDEVFMGVFNSYHAIWEYDPVPQQKCNALYRASIKALCYGADHLVMKVQSKDAVYCTCADGFNEYNGECRRCPPDYEWRNNRCEPLYSQINPDKDRPQACTQAPSVGASASAENAAGAVLPDTYQGNPINVATGAKHQTEVDYVGSGNFPLAVVRPYFFALKDMQVTSYTPPPVTRKVTIRQDVVSSKVRHNYDLRVGVEYILNGRKLTDPPTPTTPALRYVLTRPDGGTKSFWVENGTFRPDPGERGEFKVLTDSTGKRYGYTYRNEQGDLETYTTLDQRAGYLTALRNRSGLTQTLTYSLLPGEDMQINQVRDDAGRVLTFQYTAINGVNRIAGFTTPAGAQYRYSYTATGQVASLIHPDGTTRQYLFEDSRYPDAMTGIVDENGQRFATFAYDSKGKAILSEHAGGADRISVQRMADGSTITTDANGHRTTETYQVLASQSRYTRRTLQSADGSQQWSVHFGYDGNGRPTYAPDWLQRATSYNYDAQGRPITQAIGDSGSGGQRTISTEWHPSFLLPTRTTESGRETRFEYDVAGNLLARTLTDTSTGKSLRWAYGYDAKGRMLRSTDPAGRITTFAYDSLGQLTRMTEPSGAITRYTAYDLEGKLTKLTLPSGAAVTLAYNSRGQVVLQQAGALITRYDYDAAGQLIRETHPDGTRTDYSYDAAHRLIGRVDAAGQRTAYTLDGKGQVLETTVTDASGTLIYRQRQRYDALGRVVEAVDGQNGQTRIDYTDRVDYYYQLATETDPLGQTRRSKTDSLFRLVSEQDAQGWLTQYFYDNLDQTTRTGTPLNLWTEYSFNKLGQQELENSPDSGRRNDTWDAQGRLSSRQNAKGQITRFSYTAAGQLQAITYADGHVLSLSYGSSGTAVGQITSLTSPDGDIAYRYDNLGRITGETRTLGGKAFVLAYARDSGGRLSAITYPSGGKLKPVYDAQGQVSRVDWTANGSTRQVARNVSWHGLGELAGLTLLDGHTLQRTYDLKGQVITHTLVGDTQSLTRDAAGQVQRLSASGTGFQQPPVDYQYDPTGRLRTATVTGPDGTQTYRYDYDANGNRNSLQVNGQNYALTVDGYSNRTTAATGPGVSQTFRYDATGNQIDDGRVQYQYDARDRLVQATVNGQSWRYAYDPLGRRSSKTGPDGTVTYYVYAEAGRLLGEYDANGVALKEYLWLGSLPLAVVSQGTVYPIHADPLGTPRAVTDVASRKVIWRWKQEEPFGANPAEEDPDNNGSSFSFNLRFPGQYRDAESGRFYNTFRDYDPASGRYVQSDPIGLAAGQNSTYAYVDGNPVSYSDPTGLCPMCAWGAWAFYQAVVWGPRAAAVAPVVAELASGVPTPVSTPVSAASRVASKAVEACAANYRSLFTKARPDLPEGWHVHHSFPQTYEELMRTAGINIHDTQFLRGVSQPLHSKITTEWARFNRQMGGNPTAAQVADFAKHIDSTYGGQFMWPGF